MPIDFHIRSVLSLKMTVFEVVLLYTKNFKRGFGILKENEILSLTVTEASTSKKPVENSNARVFYRLKLYDFA